MTVKNSTYVFWLLVLMLFHCISNMVWVYLDSFPFGADELGHLENGFSFFRMVNNPRLFFSVETIFPHKWGPLLYVITTLLGKCFGFSHFVVMSTNSICLCVMLVCVYLIGVEMKNSATGFWAALLLSFYPIVFHYTHKYSYEIPMMAMVCMTFYFLLKTNGLRHVGFSILCGVSLGLCVLAGPRTLFFLVGPFVFFIVKYGVGGVRKSREDTLTQIVCVTLICSIGFWVSLLWFYDKTGMLFKINRYFVGDMDVLALGESDPQYYAPQLLWSFENIFYHVMGLLKTQLFPVFTAAFVCGLAGLVWKRYVNDCVVATIVWFVSAYVLFVFIEKCPRFTLQYLPACALLTVHGISCMTKGRWRKICAVVLVIVGLSQYVVFAYGNKILPLRLRIAGDECNVVSPFARLFLPQGADAPQEVFWAREIIDHYPDSAQLTRKEFGAYVGGLLDETRVNQVLFVSEPWFEYLRVLEYFVKVENANLWLEGKIKTALCHPIHENRGLSWVMSENQKSDVVVYLSHEKDIAWPAADSLSDAIAQERRRRWPVRPEEEYRVHEAWPSQLEERGDDFVLRKRVDVEAGVFGRDALFIFIYSRKSLGRSL